MSHLRKWLVRWIGKGEIADVGPLELWYETFGKKEDPCFLLIMGGGCQGILWPDAFCRKLADLGFFVVRFDARDTGYSSYIDYQKEPYTLFDMAKDCSGLLDALGIYKAHVMGTSMGGAIAQLMAVHFRERIETLTLIATTVDFRNLVSAIEGKSLEGLPLSSPTQPCLHWIEAFSKNHKELSWLEKIRAQLEGWKILNGPEVPFDTKYYGKALFKTICRQRSYRSLLNHVAAIVSSVDLLLDTLGKIQAPVLIVQGRNDPIFPQDHAEFLARSSLQSSLHLVEKMGHNLNACFYDEILQEVDLFLEEKKRF